jgi:hypothetical protein
MHSKIEDKEFIMNALLSATNNKEVRLMAMYVIFHTLHSGNLTPPKTKAALARLSLGFKSVS